jgi:hypothetical protein
VVSLGPAEVHAEKHLGPVGGFGAARTRAYRQEGVALVVLAAEEQLPPGPLVLADELFGLLEDVGEERLIRLGLGQVQQLDCRLGPRFETAPQLQLFAQTLSFAQRLLGRALVIPETGRAGAGVQIV